MKQRKDQSVQDYYVKFNELSEIACGDEDSERIIEFFEHGLDQIRERLGHVAEAQFNGGSCSFR